MTITWRPATEQDVGRLARFRDKEHETWRYGMLVVSGADEGGAWFRQFEDDNDDSILVWKQCEVQEVNK